MSNLVKVRDANVVQVRNAAVDSDSLLAVVPSGEIHAAREYGPFRPRALDVDLPVLTGYFPALALAFDLDEELPIVSNMGLLLLTPDSPAILTFTLQVGPSIACWFADVCDEHVWGMLEQWDARGTMALAANLDAGRVQFDVRPFALDEGYLELRGLALGCTDREQRSSAFHRLIVRLYADSAANRVVVSSLAGYPKLEQVHMNIVRTEYTRALAVPVVDLPFSHPVGRVGAEWEARRLRSQSSK